MVTIINGFRQPSPIAQGIREVGQAFFGDRLEAGLRQAQFDRLQQDLDLRQREQETKEALAREFARSSPEIANALLGGVSANDFTGFNLSRAASNAAAAGGDLLGNLDLNAAQLGAGASAGSTGLGFREGEANQSARSREAANISAGAAIRGAQIRAAQEAQAAADRLAFEREKLGQELVAGIDAATGQPAFRQRNAVDFRFQPALSEDEIQGARLNQNFGRLGELPIAEREVLGANPSETNVVGDVLRQAASELDVGSLPQTALREAFGFKAPSVTRLRDAAGNSFVSTDGGLTDIDGRPVPADAVEIRGVTATDLQGAGIAPTTANLTEAFQESAQLRALNDTLGLMEQLAQSSPEVFGLVGALRSGAKAVANAAASIDAAFGGGDRFQRAFNDAAQEAFANADPSGRAALQRIINDSRLDRVRQLHSLLLFQAAGALAGQSGRDLSDKDVARIEKLLPNPQGIGNSQQAVLGQLGTVRDLLGLRQQANRERLQGDFSGTGAPPSAGAAQRIRVDANGNIIQ